MNTNCNRSRKLNGNKTFTTVVATLAVLTALPCTVRAQDTSRNYVKTVTMLNAAGTDSVVSVQYYDGLGRPTLAVATAGPQGQTACAMTTYDAVGREKRRYVPVPGSGLDYMGESDVQAASYGFYHDNGGFTESRYDALDRVTAVDIGLHGEPLRRTGQGDGGRYRR